MSIENIFIIIVALSVPVVIYFITRKRKTDFDKRVELALRQNRFGLDSGVSIYFEDTIDWVISAEQKIAINSGLREVFERAIDKGYQVGLDPRNYTIVFLESQLRNDLPVFRMITNDYENTVFDQGGFIYAAEDAYDPERCIILLPQYPYDRPDLNESLARAVGYGAEHCILNHNDHALYEATKVHNQNAGHPLF